MFQEYPKALYRGEEFTTVLGAEAEAEKRAEGWHDYGQDAIQAAEASEPDAKDERAELLAKAKELGIDAKGTWGVQKLKDAIQAAEDQ
ncbi:hypothetical protein [Achromobacter sp. NFACC18-2]|uniref:hypothetical protein n=1 Tax=Achromobacter sp. NFACC18-2 TaxID=1564112 RepID=UPI0008D66462|nr:hypothetical protein [Achromobacter sp. NFACC18-2]SEJ99999.1 hypothetical protein SAMN03159494_04256 [Achromobacter sp. NFACC18-2]